MKRTVAFAALIALVASPAFAARFYVDKNVASAGNGSSWQTAFRSLQTAISRANSGDEIWVAEGTYTGGFTIPSNVTLLGGFRSGQGNALNRRPLLQRTILDGGGTQRVLDLNLASVVDGFIVQNGRAGTPGGGGALCNGTSSIVRNCIFANNQITGGLGSALLVRNQARPFFMNCVFTQNKGTGDAIEFDRGGGTFMQITVHDNVGDGVEMQNQSTPWFFNSTFTKNTGRGVSDISTNNSPKYENCHFDGNSISHFYFRGQEMTTISAVNSVSFCVNNIGGAAGFVSPANWDFGVSSTSALIDKGQYVNNFPATDLLLEPRGYDDPRYSGPAGFYDIGAVTWRGIRLSQSGNASPGSMVTLSLLAPNDSGRSYQVATALDAGVIPIDSRKLRLALDGLFFATARNQLPAVFVNYTGQLSNTGTATARINIPNFSVLRGISMHSAFLVVNGASPSGISKISSPIVTTIN